MPFDAESPVTLQQNRDVYYSSSKTYSITWHGPTCHEHHDRNQDDTSLSKEVVGDSWRHKARSHFSRRKGKVQRKRSKAQCGGQAERDGKPQQAPQYVSPVTQRGTVYSSRLLWQNIHQPDVYEPHRKARYLLEYRGGTGSNCGLPKTLICPNPAKA